MDISDSSEQLSSKDIQRICHENGADMLLILDDFNMYRDKYMDVIENDDGSKSRTAHFFVKVSINMTLYDSNGQIIDNEPIYTEQRLSSRSVLSGLFSVGPSLGNRGKEIYPMLTELGASYVENFKYQRIPISVRYYAKGELEAVEPMIETQDWENARRSLLDIYHETSDPQIRRRAAHNIYHIFMAIEDKQGAMEWQMQSNRELERTNNH